MSGEPIPRGRLEAVPEAIRTVEEQQRFEQGAPPADLAPISLACGGYNLAMDRPRFTVPFNEEAQESPSSAATSKGPGQNPI